MAKHTGHGQSHSTTLAHTTHSNMRDPGQPSLCIVPRLARWRGGDLCCSDPGPGEETSHLGMETSSVPPSRCQVFRIQLPFSSQGPGYPRLSFVQTGEMGTEPAFWRVKWVSLCLGCMWEGGGEKGSSREYHSLTRKDQLPCHFLRTHNGVASWSSCTPRSMSYPAMMSPS